MHCRQEQQPANTCCFLSCWFLVYFVVCIGGTGPTKCFTIEHTQSDVVSWQEAQEECESRDETLATILTPYEGKRIADKLPAESTAWIGLQISHNPHREWHWLHSK